MPIVLAALGTLLAVIGGFLVGQWWQRRGEQEVARDTRERFDRLLQQIAEQLPVGDNVARAVDPIATNGRGALKEVLLSLRDHGGYEAVVVADDSGLVVAANGPGEASELIAVEAAAFGSVADRIPGDRQSILQALPDGRWTLHRYFNVDDVRLSLSATRRGATPRVDALDGALGAVVRVLTSANDEAA